MSQTIFASILNDLVYVVVIGGFGILVLSFFLKKKPMELLSEIKDKLFSGGNEDE